MFKRLVIPCLIVLLTLVGCGNQTIPVSKQTTSESQPVREVEKPKIPEPYTQMLEQVKNNDLEMVSKYADLTIKDFPDSPYVYNAYLIKNAITLSKIRLRTTLANYLLQGTQNAVNMGLSKEENDLVTKIFDDNFAEHDKLQSELAQSTQYLLSNYSNKKINGELKLESIPIPQGISNIADTGLTKFEYFSKVGYPVPTENDYDNAKKLFFKPFYLTYLANGNFNYAGYFSELAFFTGAKDKTKQKELLNLVLKITENDQYNEYRIKAQESLSKLQ